MANQSDSDADNKTEALASSVRAAYDSAEDRAGAAREHVANGMEDLEGKADGAAREAEANINELVTKAEFAIIDHPLAAVGVAFAAGWVTARLFR